MNVKADDHAESNGTRISESGDGNFQTRLGLKVFDNMALDTDNVSNIFTSFAEINWIHHTREFGTRLDTDLVEQAGAKNVFEAKIGANGKINQQFGMWGSLDHQFGQKNYKNTSLVIGAKYDF